MTNLKFKTIVIVLVATISFNACSNSSDDNSVSPSTLPETDVVYIPLAGPAADSENEYSGLTWQGDILVMLRQYPFESDTISWDGVLYGIPKERIIAYLDGIDTSAITPDTLWMNAPGLERFNSHGSGYEAIAFDRGDNYNYSYFAIESNLGYETSGYLVRGYGTSPDASTLTRVESQSGISNLSEEAIFIFDGRIYAIHEANGINVNPNPVAHAFHLNLADEITIPFPNIEYRITDATNPDDSGKFWVTNYFWEGDSSDLKPANDELVEKYGIGETNNTYPGIERLIQLQVTETGIKLVDRAPIYLKLKNDGGRNWEGIAQLDDRGLLIITDKFPTTVLGFVKF